MWPLIKGYLQGNGLASKFNVNMSNFLHWRDLKHLSSPTTIDYSDGQTFLDILKCTLPCIVQLLPPNSCLIRVIRIMTKVRIMLGLEVTVETHLELLDKFIAEYERICKTRHQPNQNTRVGEGFQQEIAAQYEKTNGKDAEHQPATREKLIMDENEETMVRLDMKFETCNCSNLLYRDFNIRLREYLAEYHPNYPVCDDENIQIEPCKVLYVEFQLKVDWNNGRDILRCNPKFHGRPRYDSIIYEAQGDKLAMGQLESVFRCHLPHKVTLDLAMIHPYWKSTWAARTHTDCPMREWGPGSTFIALEHVTRGALLYHIFGAPHKVFYVIDCVDGDMFLRINNID
ncbi:hypothetical protein B0H10DRAFT_1970094 [Mycena sp. CBHHK59/15]|nr:hypothetical protein B0H10DRAFT_1970094 [Mycena sp. CBHHK59/15]